MNSKAACDRYIMARWNDAGIEIDAPAGAFSSEALGLLRKHKPLIEMELLPLAGAWLRIGELGEHGELQILLDGRTEETGTTELAPPAVPFPDVHRPAEVSRTSPDSAFEHWRCPLGHREYWVSDYGLKICCRCHPNTHAKTTAD
ncbi:MAG: hypothetical protein EOM37_11285 [Proteobacteria bacterium]|nr:hypothetical protein [Pseudomonadota bacterium]